MVVKVRFGRGPVVTRRKGKNSRMARLAASFLTLASISCAALGVWRVGADLDLAGGFVFSQGFLSHWQVWIGAAAAIQYAGWRLNRYAGGAAVPLEDEAEPDEKAQATSNDRAVANV